MKKLIYLLIFGIAIQTNLKAQNDDGRTMGPIIRDAIPIIEKIESDGMEIVRMEYDILKDEKTTYRFMQEGWTYRVFAFGDYRVKDIDVEVYKKVGEDWSLVNKDNDASSAALVTIKPFYTGMYMIKVKGYKYISGSNGCHYGLIIFHE